MLTSRQNSLIKEVRGLSDKRNRDKLGLYTAEGVKLVNDAILYGAKVKKVFCTNKAMPQITAGDYEMIEVSDSVFKSLSGEVSPQGALAVIEKPSVNFTLSKNSCVLLDGVSDPSNVGAIVRTAAALGYSDILLTEDCADPFGSKSVRASMGGVFRVNFFVSDRATLANSVTLPIIVADMDGKDVYNLNIDTNFCLVIGNEGKGVSEVIRKKATHTVSISMENNMESLNASVSAGILMYFLKSH